MSLTPSKRVKNYNVFYNVNDELRSVTILRVFYNHRNI
jgi:plasmid stabilization system protein ParE